MIVLDLVRVNHLSMAPPITSVSLLDRLRLSTDEAAWREFVDRYAPILYDWCRQWHMQDADARDVTQSVLVLLMRRLRQFHYDPGQSFRRWLWTVARHAWYDFLADRPQFISTAEHLDEATAREDLLARLDSEFDRELLEEASARVRLRVEPHTWEAFELLAFDSMPGAQAAAKLKISIAAAFKAKSKVLKMLREELRRLNGSPDDAAGGES